MLSLKQGPDESKVILRFVTRPCFKTYAYRQRDSKTQRQTDRQTTDDRQIDELKACNIKMKFSDREHVASLGTGYCHEVRAAEGLAVGSLYLLQVSHEGTTPVEWVS